MRIKKKKPQTRSTKTKRVDKKKTIWSREEREK